MFMSASFVFSSSSMCWVCRDSPSFAGSLHDPWTHVICSRCRQLTCEACDRIDINGTSHVCKNCLGSDAHHDGEDGDCLPVAIDILLRGALKECKNSDARTGLYLLLIDNCERMRDFWHRQVSELPNTSLGPGDPLNKEPRHGCSETSRICAQGVCGLVRKCSKVSPQHWNAALRF